MAQYTFDTLLDFEFANIALPSGYTKLKYIENTANNYILLPYKANNNTSVKIAVSWNSLSGDQTPYGCDHWWSYRNSGYIIFISNGHIYVDYGNQRFDSGVSASINTFYIIEESPNGFFVNAVKKLPFNAQTFTCTNDFCVFTYGAGQTSTFLNGKIKIVQVGDDNISYNLIPCSYNGDIGMYDTIGGTFYGNSGTGTFVSGGEAQTSTYQDGDVVTITDVGITLTYTNGNLYFSTNESLTLSQFYSLCSICKGANGVLVTITDLNNLQVTSNGTDWLITADTTLATLSQFNTLCSICKGANGVLVTISENKSYYHWQNNDWEFWYQETEPLAFKGITFEQTDFWQKPESVFRGFSFEIVDKKGGGVLFHGME